jgi:hypothetical protein
MSVTPKMFPAKFSFYCICYVSSVICYYEQYLIDKQNLFVIRSTSAAKLTLVCCKSIDAHSNKIDISLNSCVIKCAVTAK